MINQQQNYKHNNHETCCEMIMLVKGSGMIVQVFAMIWAGIGHPLEISIKRNTLALGWKSTQNYLVSSCIPQFLLHGLWTISLPAAPHLAGRRIRVAGNLSWQKASSFDVGQVAGCLWLMCQGCMALVGEFCGLMGEWPTKLALAVTSWLRHNRGHPRQYP